MTRPGDLDAILADYRAGDEPVQRALLAEVEPLLFGYLRSLLPSGDDAWPRAVAGAHELALAFHLRALAGRIAVRDARGLRALGHRMAVARLRSDAPASSPLSAAADPDDGTLAARLPALARPLLAERDEAERLALADRLAGDAPRGDADARLAALVG